MFDTVVIATDGSGSAQRAVEAALDLAGKFDATVHALYVVDSGEVESTPEDVRDVLERALATTGGRALTFVREAATTGGETEADVVTAVREGDPAPEIRAYADEVDADLIATGTRGRHGDHGFLLGSVAEAVVRSAPMPVLSVRQLEGEANPEREAV
ncbi:universal stress protein [Haloarcula onubensis]|uniref:Universal stress protein n=1 Tax=Haloarcula onubensis TaxID=2950539 RepID=A0ABU2FNX6_9EURY|nr:universal stress protein [Halomicroarcula sp. S3CR25-11]MDS0281962.1 universal stress protein [Halomicroarcula sp. S3CR25-11]